MTKLPQLVVCAANRYTMMIPETGEEYLIVTGVRHYDKLMHQQINALDEYYWSCKIAEEQGFVDNGNFLTREEALRVALLEDQVRRSCGGDTFKLFSENLY